MPKFKTNIRNSIRNIQFRIGNAVSPHVASAANKALNKIRFSEKWEAFTDWFSGHKKTGLGIFMGLMTVLLAYSVIALMVPMNRTGNASNDTSQTVQEIDAVNKTLNGFRETQYNGTRIRMKERAIGGSINAIKAKIDSIQALPSLTYNDSIQLYQYYQQLEAIINSSNDSQNEKD